MASATNLKPVSHVGNSGQPGTGKLIGPKTLTKGKVAVSSLNGGVKVNTSKNGKC